MRQEIEKRIVEYYRTKECDGYGQLKTIDAYDIVKNEDEMEVLKKIVNVATYGWTYGTYLGFAPFGSFKDEYVETLCKEAYMENKSRYKMNNW